MDDARVSVPPDEEVYDSGYTDIPLPESTCKLLVVLGIVRWDSTLNVYALTEKGRQWLREWCEARIEEREIRRRANERIDRLREDSIEYAHDEDEDA